MKQILYDLAKFTGIIAIFMVANLFLNLDYGLWAFSMVVWHSFITHDNPIKKCLNQHYPKKCASRQ